MYEKSIEFRFLYYNEAVLKVFKTIILDFIKNLIKLIFNRDEKLNQV
ncbi:hypothetical protein KORDIASMS9_02874 [Kordia sp. SMS9]|nr:hypothetical protein KORDIASMS9_02874 [Kordia sp. SMS9]